MLYAQLATGEKLLPKKHERALCPFCNGIVIAKCGEIYSHYWAHKTIKDCDTWYEPESDWHLEWKRMFPKESVEVTLMKNDQRHRADIVGDDGTVIELQHSPISTVMIHDREVFYGNMIWIFDMALKRGSFQRKAQINEKEFSFKWSRPKWSLITCKKPLYFDFGTKKILCVTSLKYSGGTGYYVDKNDFILECGGMPQDAS